MAFRKHKFGAFGFRPPQLCNRRMALVSGKLMRLLMGLEWTCRKANPHGRDLVFCKRPAFGLPGPFHLDQGTPSRPGITFSLTGSAPFGALDKALRLTARC